MQGADLDRTRYPAHGPEAVERRVVEHVPDHRHGRQHHRQRAHFQHRAVEQPGADRRADQHGDDFKADGVDDAFSEGFVGGLQFHDVTLRCVSMA
ncbi:hypothetical protein D3C75_1035190 [compost metagenome]